MKMTTARTARTTLWTVGCLALIMTACSDGEMTKAPVDQNIGKPIPVVINNFKVEDALAPKDASKTDADEPPTINAGGIVKVSWDVSNAQKIAITDSKGRFLSNVVGLKDSTESDPLTANETFTLTAEGADGSKAQKTATVVVRKKEIKIVSFTADPKEVRAGEATTLCWRISDPAATVTVKAGDEGIYPGNDVPEPTPTETPPTETPASDVPSPEVTVTTVSKAMRFLLKGADTPVAPPADGYAAPADTTTIAPPTEAPEVCTLTHKPTQDTTYTLVVMDGDAEVARQDVSVTILPEPATIAAFVAQPAQLSGPGEVTLTWRATPSDVTVSIDHGVTTNDKAEGEKKVQVTDTTTFTLTATGKDGKSKTQTVTVTLPSAADRRVEAKVLTPSIFAGETAKISITHGNASGKVSVVDALGRTPAFTTAAGVVSIIGATAGSTSYTIDIDGERSNPVMVEVRDLNQHDRGAWNGLALQGLGAVVAGSSSKTAELGLASLLDFTRFSPVKYDFGKNFADKMKTHAGYMSKFAPYTVHAMMISAKGRVIAGVTGGLLYSDDTGASWNVLDVIPAYDTSYKYKDAEESHTGCFGVKRTGTKSFSATIWMVNVFEVCDLAYDEAAAGKDRLLIATDFGVFYIDGVEGRIKDPTNKANAMQGTLKKDNALFGKAVNSIAIAKAGDATVVVAGAIDGVYVNAKRGDYKSWQQIDKAGLKGAVNTVAVVGSTIYAGTDKGLFKSNGLDAGATFIQVSIATDPVAVKALAVDAADPATLYVGTNKGLKLSRDCAGSFADVTADVGEVRNIATAADSGRSAVALTSQNGLFTSVGVAGSAGSCSGTRPSPTTDTPKEPATPATTGTRPPPASTGPGTVAPK